MAVLTGRKLCNRAGTGIVQIFANIMDDIQYIKSGNSLH